MWNLGKVRSNAKGGKFLSLEPLFWQSEALLEIPWEPRAFSKGQRPSMSFATDERTRLFWERAETDLVEQLAASERVFDAKLTPEAVRQRLLRSVRQSRGGDWMLKAKLPRALLDSLWLMTGMRGLSLEVTDLCGATVSQVPFFRRQADFCSLKNSERQPISWSAASS